LPGRLVRRESDPASGDAAVDEAFDGAGTTYDFYRDLYGRNSLDGEGMVLRSIVHYGRNLANAFWDGQQILYGDGDGKVFDRFTKSLEVVAHELTHGVIQHTSNLMYEGEPGALNESFADVMAIQIEQWARGTKAEDADWWLGGEIIFPSVGVRGIRTFTAKKAYEDHPVLGTDQQPKHTDQQYEGPDDNGGVHINSGIPNHAFYLVATELGGHSWDQAGRIWYRTLQELDPTSSFSEAAATTIRMGAEEFGDDVERIVRSAWEQVGVTPAS
ncbi:MAG: M4 family metallopeptidase, partial [Acidimicrobiia bacterium]